METLVCEGLSKDYGQIRALDRIDLRLEEGKIIGLLGPNGSGKTTLIKLASRLLVPSEGRITICGEVPSEKSKAIVSYLPDRNFLPDWMNSNDLIALYEDFFADFSKERAIEMLGSLNIDMTMPLKKMSKGTKEKVQLIMTMSRRAKLYLLDEPIAGVDPAARDYILRTIISNYDENATVLISTHLIADVENVLDEAIFLKQGKIVLHESVDELKESTGKSVDEYFREVFKC
ncbi:MAG: ABC transporter ATP-binding protein [Erysipelotrichaceae bacterium]|nr:ABC transporter ATP-binding protein [Erysipelotrichaceae bacterium]MBQ1775216.1 ABC transporter ATP-binding protein [Erysipelotrichaceae bacterium]MBQ1811766.1 ABC transporter ATP-binding protein [Erysipelotrichaceae bacterium]MBQ1910629.1 ABC transporter ATP-binding protein [Erysipelotrichaceae bacterium]MBQ2078434.1 ABC transporter ATP-binding protein [Erysipelotrichaceae bacterium]